ncbi:MAG TPA: DHA2 family efflux MFS transporter permease subunit [Acidimicrobiales bacterium]|jgi:EmrB/QacA subfamily drug resistance transporter|nr:DHA2 family efflux MFS transporter permease subunit [Acidimicrobiales bacterium]
MRAGGEAGDTTPSGASADPLSLSNAQGRWVVAATVLGSGIALLDSTVVGIALPSIGREFHGGVGTLQWVVTGYTLTLAAFLLLGGALGDRYGRKRVFSIGVAWFAVASALCGLAPTAGILIAARFVQGVGGALLAPGSLAILQTSFRPDDRARAIGAWSGLSGVAAAAGPLVGGYLLAIGSWRWIFFINLPIAAAVLVITARHVPESRDPTASGRVDTVGAALAVVFLAGLTYGLIEAPTLGWSSPAVVACLVVAGLAAPAFLFVEHRRAHPMLPLHLFRSRQFSGANGVTFAVYGALGGALFLLPIELQIVKGYTALESGVALLPLTVVMLALSARSGALSARIGPRLQMTVGPLVVGAGLALLTRATDAGSYWTQVFPAVLIFSLGLAVTVAPLTATAMGAAPPENSGVASAVNNVVARAGGLLAVAVLPLLAGLTGAAALDSATLATGFRTAMVISGIACAAGGVLAALTVRNPPRHPKTLVAAERAEPTWNCGVGGPPPNPSLAAAEERCA